MTEKPRVMDIEEKKAVVVDWIAKFTESDKIIEIDNKIEEIDVAVLKEVLIHCGADFE